ncbi:hypothetical protein [Streptomyces longisporoflavus]|uniref:Uncharacterized protein n=1 Tax=Streptomyces longisporoflavus TaxID=28044 RepID=A0ABW7QJP6_9ACTN
MSEHARAVIDIEDIDPTPWVMVPPRSGLTAPWSVWADIRAWSQEVAEELWEDHELDPGPNGVDFVAGTLERCAEAFAPPGSDHWVFLHLDQPADLPLPVCVAVGPASGPREATLRALTEADDPRAVEPAVVHRVRAGKLGEGLSTFRYVPQEDSIHLLACVRYGWQVPEHEADVVVWAATGDVGHLLRAVDDLEQLARSLAIRCCTHSGGTAAARSRRA